MSETTTAEMDRWIWLQVKPTMGESAHDDDTKAKLLAIAARLSALDKVATAAAQMVEWTDDDEVNSNARPAFDAIKAALKEAGYGE